MTGGYVDTAIHFKTTLSKDVRDLLLGDEIAYGAHRHVFKHATDPGLVVKLEDIAKHFYNVSEWQVWQRVKSTAHAKWFAPCVDIGPSGTILMMKKAEPATAAKLPRMVPAFFTDLKAENWGFINGKPVCIDYGLHLLLEVGMTTRMRRANWDG